MYHDEIVSKYMNEKKLPLKMRDFGVERKTSSTAVNRGFIPIVLTSSKLIMNSVEVHL